MKLFLVALGVHLLVLACSGKQSDKDEKELVMLEVGSAQPDERPKRASAQDELKILRQAPDVPPEYYQLLQQLAQRDQAVAAQQPQYIQQVVLPKDVRQQAPTRYILSQDGRLLEEQSYLAQQPQQFSPAGPQYTFQQQPQGLPAQQPQLARPVPSPELAALSRQQQRLQQEYADAPLRAQIAGGAARARPRPVQSSSPGPNSQSPQVFAQSQPRNEARLRASVQSDTPNFVYTPVPADAQAIIQQQLAQLSIASDADGRQFFTQSARPGLIPQQIIYQQPSQQEFTQERVVYQQQQPFPTRRPVTQTTQPQTLAQGLPQQYLIETTRQQPQQSAHYVPQEVAQQVQYVQQSQVLAQQAAAAAAAGKQQQPQQQYQSTLLQPVNSRGLFDPKPSRSSIFVSRTSSTPRPGSIEAGGEPSSQKIPVVRIPPPTEQRPLTRQELDALVNAGYAIQPVPVPVLVPEPGNYLKSKRQQPILLEDNKNHVVYENRQDGVQYQYSPGSSPGKVKKSVAASGASADDGKGTQKAVVDGSESSPVLAYFLGVGGES